MNETPGFNHLAHDAALALQHALQLAGKHQVDLGADNHEAHVGRSCRLRDDREPVQQLLHDALVVVQHAVHNDVNRLPRRHEELVRGAVLQLPGEIPERKLQIEPVLQLVCKTRLEVFSKCVHSNASR